MKLILIRGLPGSGKSTMAKEFAYHFGTVHLETDQFWGADYNFDITKIEEAHEWCQQTTLTELTRYDTVVVSNTFTTKKELKPYFDIAKEFGIVPNVIHCQNKFNNVHNVPEEVMKRMSERFEYDITELFEGK